MSWAKGGDQDWRLALAGLFVSLVTVVSLIGDAVPGTAVFGRIEAGLKRVEEREKLLDWLLHQSDRDAHKISAIDHLREDMNAVRRQQFVIGTGCYLVPGSFFALFLASDVYQALATGAGYLGAMGLKKGYAQRKLVKGEIADKLKAALPSAEQDDGRIPGETGAWKLQSL